MLETLVYIFLAVIALSALLQAGLVVGLALGMRRAEVEIDEFAADYDRRVLPLMHKLGVMIDGLSSASDGAVDQARRLELRISSFADNVGRRVERASAGVADSFDDTAEVVGSYVVPGIGRSHPISQLGSVWHAVRAALSLLRG